MNKLQHFSLPYSVSVTADVIFNYYFLTVMLYLIINFLTLSHNYKVYVFILIYNFNLFLQSIFISNFIGFKFSIEEYNFFLKKKKRNKK